MVDGGVSGINDNEYCHRIIGVARLLLWYDDYCSISLLSSSVTGKSINGLELCMVYTGDMSVRI